MKRDRRTIASSPYTEYDTANTVRNKPEPMKPINWEQLFVPNGSLLELIIRGTLMYLVLFAVFRALGRRHVGSLRMLDLLLMVRIADAAQNGMASEYKSKPHFADNCIIPKFPRATTLGHAFAPIRAL